MAELLDGWSPDMIEIGDSTRMHRDLLEGLLGEHALDPQVQADLLTNILLSEDDLHDWFVAAVEAEYPELTAEIRERLLPARQVRESIRAELLPRLGTPPSGELQTDPNWTQHQEVPMSRDTALTLNGLAISISTYEHWVNPDQVAGYLLEKALEQLPPS